MKIVQINCLAQTGSTGRLASQLAESLRAGGDECGIAYSRGAGGPGAFCYETLPERKAHALASRLTARQGFYSQNATRRLLAYLEQQQPDVVHLHNLHDNNIHLPLLLGYLAQHDLPTVLTLHDCWFFTGHCCYYSMAGCARWKTGCGECPQPRADLPSWFCDASASVWREKQRLFAAIPRLAVVGVSDWITQQARESLLQCARVCERIYNWVDFSVFFPASSAMDTLVPQTRGKRAYLSVAACWSRAKGLDDLLALAPLLGKEACLVLAGELPRGIVLPPNVYSVGAVREPARLAQLYRAAAAFLNLSYQETFGLVSAEALACGTPVLARAVTANPELAPAQCGVTVSPCAKPQELRAALAALDARSGEAQRAACVEFAKQSFSRLENTAQYRALYARLAAMR